MLRLLSVLNQPDAKAAGQAREELRLLGLNEQQIEYGRRLVHPDPRVREELAQRALETDEPTRSEVLLELTYDRNQKVQVAVLEALATFEPSPNLKRRVRELADSDVDSIVRGYARLLIADWSTGSSPASPSSGAAAFQVQPTPHEEQLPDPSRAHNASAPGQNPADSAGLQTVQPFWDRASQDDQSYEPAAGGFAASESSGRGKNSASNIGSKNRQIREQPSKQEGPVVWALEEETQGLAEAPDAQSFGEPQENLPEFQLTLGTEQAHEPDESLPHFGRLATTQEPRLYEEPFSRDPSQNPSLISDVSRNANGEPVEGGPKVLRRPIESPFAEAVPPVTEEFELLSTPIEAPTGFAGRSGVLPTDVQENSHFVPVEDRWRIGFPDWDRYGKGHPWLDDYPYLKGHWWDPYNQNVLKGDYPIIGQHTFLNIVATMQHITEVRQVPTATTPFESTFNPFQENFFGDPEQFFHTTFAKVQVNLFHGNEAFKPFDWQLRVTPVFNRNYLRVKELAVVNPDVRKGRRRTRHDFSLEEWFVEAKLADLGPDYDFMSVRAGSQFFTSDFRGFVFFDTNRAVRLFGSRFGNRDQFNVIWFDQTEKETNSELNTYDDRHQNTVILNYFRQDFVFPGYTAQVNFHYNRDQASFKFDENNFLVRPDPAGTFRPHEIESYYFGITGDGHIRRLNISNAFYWVVGEDELNPIAGQEQDIDAHMAAVELSVDRDWVRFRTSWFHASGDDDVFDDKARGFDAILDNPNFAGGPFSYWQRQAIRLFGVNLVQRQSLVPNLRSSKIQGQTNFVNPGLNLVNAGMDFEITPKLKAIFNANYLWFDTTHPLEIFTFQNKIDPEIGTDVSIGVEYRPFLNDNAIILAGFATFVPGKGFDDVFGVPELGGIFNPDPIKAEQMFSNFVEVILTY